MQWLIDLIIEAIGIPPVFIDRGDPAAWDWQTGDFTIDGGYHDLDLSAIVPANASAVLIGAFFEDNIVGQAITFRKSGNTEIFNASSLLTQVANVLKQGDLIIAASPNQKVEYAISAGMDSVFAIVRGWWL